MAVLFWYIEKRGTSLRYCKAAYTGQVAFLRYQKHTAMYNWYTCLTEWRSYRLNFFDRLVGKLGIAPGLLGYINAKNQGQTYFAKNILMILHKKISNYAYINIV